MAASAMPPPIILDHFNHHPIAMLEFRNRRFINEDNYEALPEIFHRQMAISAVLGFGEDFSTPIDFLNESEGEVELWDIFEVDGSGEVIYDCWVYLADTANVFHHGTDIDTGVGMIQFSFECLKGKDADCKALAAEIEAAFHSRNAIEDEDLPSDI
jgi:hypothetical protein